MKMTVNSIFEYTYVCTYASLKEHQSIELVPSFSAEWYEPYKGAVLVS